jgi:hypothetical protein
MKNEFLSLSEALSLCEEKGKPLGRTRLRSNGIRYGFMSKSEDGYHWTFAREGLLKFLTRMDSEVPEGWVSVTYLAKKHKVTIHGVYYWIKTWNIPTIECGTNHVKYINEIGFELTKRKHRRIPLK